MDYSALIQMVIGLVGEENARKMSEKQLKMLADQLAAIKGIPLPNLPDVKPEELGASNVGAMQSDPQLRSKQLMAIAEVQNIVDHGGLDLSDKVSLEQALDTARNQARRGRAGVAADFAQRGGMNSGARLVMDEDAAQAGANDLHRTGMETAALAQQRRLAAIRDASGMSGALREQDWRESESANRAKDLRDERNAQAREKAGYYNAGLPQQNFNNAMAKATGQQPAAANLANAFGTAATDARDSAAGIAGTVGAYDKVIRNGAADTGAQTYTYNPDERGDRGGFTDLSKDDEK